ncbi:hypothetical protein [Acidithrix ferrooxidans]|uniref:DUF2269 family protein n=1 Tax=Acidithrix ferrooxidans TaxID=1280514 RepID=A0A0D8HD55_9ACTN|nr:hypothetical protein [Acidithrix ferrooxidans]KJF15747.1 hypothetical protein AXFE_34050 [Acidithrix ferrooxidans]
MNPNSPIYIVLLGLHFGSVTFGFGGVGLSGLYASRLSTGDPESIKYFSSRRIGPKVLVVVALLFGLVLIALSRHPLLFVDAPWLRIAFIAYLIAATISGALIWPIEATVRRLITTGNFEMTAEVRVAMKKILRLSLIVDLAFSLALILMVTQPGHG